MDTVTVKAGHTDAEVRREAAQMLGAGAALPGLPPIVITAGRLALLDLIDSPLLREGVKPTRQDILRALYIVYSGAGAVAPVATALREAEALERSAALAATSPELYREWLAALAASASGWAEFDAQALKFLELYGHRFSLDQAFAALAQAFEDAARGFAIIPPGERGQSPFADPSGPSGSPDSATPSAAPAPSAAGQPTSGTSRWRRLATWLRPWCAVAVRRLRAR